MYGGLNTTPGERMEGTIKQVSKVTDIGSSKRLGFLMKENPKHWYNMYGTEEQLNEIAKSLKKGSKISFTEKDGQVMDLKFLGQENVKSQKQRSDEDIVNFEQLLNDANEKELTEIKTELISHDPENQIAIFKATASGKKGTFEAHGDAQASQLNKNIQPHYIRMAETRAIVRCLRWYTNNAECAEEEK